MNTIETERLILREWINSQEDLNELHKILSSDITMSFWPSPFALPQSEKWIQSNIQRYKELGFGRYAVILKDTNKIIGDCGIIETIIDDIKENDLGYIIHYPYWHKGYAAQAAKACMNYAFSEFKIKRLCANMPFDHIGSIKTAEKIGMAKEKEFYNSKNRNILTYLYSINKA